MPATHMNIEFFVLHKAEALDEVLNVFIQQRSGSSFHTSPPMHSPHSVFTGCE